jgi:histidine triad (HIT) family protein
MKTDPNCLFCKIRSHKIPSNKIYEDDAVYAFLDIRPTNTGHTLVIPKDHIENLYEMPDDVLNKIIVKVRDISKAVKSGVNADGINVVINNDAAAGQLVFHSHIHIIPRFSKDGLRSWPGKEVGEMELAESAEKIRSKL